MPLQCSSARSPRDRRGTLRNGFLHVRECKGFSSELCSEPSLWSRRTRAFAPMSRSSCSPGNRFFSRPRAGGV